MSRGTKTLLAIALFPIIGAFYLALVLGASRGPEGNSAVAGGGSVDGAVLAAATGRPTATVATPTLEPTPWPTMTPTLVPPTPVVPPPQLPTVPYQPPPSPPEGECPAVILEVFGDVYAPAACSVAWCESRYNAFATGAAGERGMFQIHPIHPDSTYDPLGNTLAAYRISSGGTNWSAWACQP